MSTRHRESTISFGRSGLGALGVAATLIALSGVAGIDCGGTTLALPEVDASATDDARVPRRFGPTGRERRGCDRFRFGDADRRLTRGCK